jgi:hypothetical protein
MPRKVNEQYKVQWDDLIVNMKQWDESLGEPTPDGCIPWVGRSSHKQGYGMMVVWDAVTREKKMATSHRIAWRIYHQTPIGRGDFIIHTCGNPACVNPDHLILGNSQSDVLKMRRKNGTIQRAHYSEVRCQESRQYRWTVEQLIWAQSHTYREIRARWSGITEGDIRRLRRLGNPNTCYKWLKLIRHKYDDNGIMLPGYERELRVEFQEEKP